MLVIQSVRTSRRKEGEKREIRKNISGVTDCRLTKKVWRKREKRKEKRKTTTTQKTR